ncbi:dystroglycan-like [Dorcoceras hygrometricum]|uniref:Dystroglycan-like n=1 Tax=Dorcoceras hygrometricum TaxID=472368 RepID=A0A2Z7DID2_9LAMI|nr:dystroglycan-like [Dorcoceras hygrometricum]
MASAYYSNTAHIDFASVLAMENPGMVSVFNALMASGLEGFLGCPVVIYESELVDFFNNGSVRDGLVVSTVNGVPVEISEQLFAETFELPVDGLADLSEIPKDKIFDARSIVSISREPLIDKVGAEEAARAPKPKAASKKRPAADVGAPVAKNKRTMRKKSSSSTDNLEIVAVAQEAVPIQMIEPLIVAPAAEDISDQPAGETDGVKAVAADVDATAEKIDEQVAEPSADLQSSHKQLGTQIVTTGLDVVDVRRVVKETHQELNAKINSLDEQVAATRNDLLEFSAQAQQSLNVITTQLRELVGYINRGGDNKKGESSSSRGPQPPPPSVSTPDFEQRVEMAQRNILERVMDTDRRESLLQAERDRERRRRELSGTKRIRRN